MKKSRLTIYDVSKATGFSSATISRIINKKGNVKKDTEKKVLEAIKKLGYRPSALAQALANNKTTNIGVVIPSANYVYISNLLYGITESARIKGFTIQLYVTSRDKSEANKIVEKVISSHVDGAIIFDDELDEEDFKMMSSYDVPVIVINTRISSNNIGSIYFGCEHLLKRIVLDVIKRNEENKPIYFLHLDKPGRLLSRMENQFIKIFSLLNIKPNLINIKDSNKFDFDYFVNFFKTHKCGYFIAPRDSISMAIINAAINNNLKVPEDVEVLSIIGTKYSRIFKPTISNMHVDMVEVGSKAIDMLDKLIKNNLDNKELKIEFNYIKMTSTKE